MPETHGTYHTKDALYAGVTLRVYEEVDMIIHSQAMTAMSSVIYAITNKFLKKLIRFRFFRN